MSNGAISNGLKLELKPLKIIYKPGELPDFQAVITNISGKNILFCQYQGTHRLLSTMTGGDYEILPFTPTPTTPLQDSDFINLQPGEKLTFHLNLSQEKDYGFVYGGYLPPSVDRGMMLKGFPGGTFSFKCHIGSHISFFNAPRGTYNHARDRKNILKEVPRSNLTVNTASAWEGDLVASVRVKFM